MAEDVASETAGVNAEFRSLEQAREKIFRDAEYEKELDIAEEEKRKKKIKILERA